MPAHGKAKEQIIHGFDNSGIIRCANASNAKQFISNNMKDTTYSVVKVPRDIIELMIYFVKRAVHELPLQNAGCFYLRVGGTDSHSVWGLFEKASYIYRT
jgi:predicted esterase YcpF (UPF0227 family)